VAHALGSDWLIGATSDRSATRPLHRLPGSKEEPEQQQHRNGSQPTRRQTEYRSGHGKQNRQSQAKEYGPAPSGSGNSR